MSNKSAMSSAAATAILFLLAACSAPPGEASLPAALAFQWYPPWTIARSADGISLRWYPDATPSSQAEQVAQLHCGSFSKTARLASDTRDGSVEIAEYRCR